MSESARRVAQLQRELAANPASRQFYQLGELLRREGKAVEAAEALRAGLAHHPRYVAAWVALGRAYVEAGQAAEAVHGLEQALALDPQNPVAWRLLGEAYLALGDRKSALEAMKNSLDLVPGDEVLQSAVDALDSELAAGAAPIRPADAEPFPASEPNEASEVLAGSPEAEAVLATAGPAEAPGDEVDGSVARAASEPVPTPPVVLPSEELTAPEPSAVGGLPPVAASETTEELFGEPGQPAEALPEPTAPPPVRSAPEEPPAPQPSEDAELFTAPETEEAPALLKAVLTASASKAASAVPVQPPASLTLARLYVQQQALDEAVRVLERLLEREPGNVEARDLLALVHDMMAPLPEAPPPLSLRERKIAALQRWLASLTLGRERATR
jgi:cytochrome c-type biogenesis protein CcmH/NrfG